MTAHDDSLEPIAPDTAVELFLDHKAMHCAESTVRNHRYRMNHFFTWCDEEAIWRRSIPLSPILGDGRE